MKITKTAFYFLNASVHSTRREIRSFVENASFEKDEILCRDAERSLLQSNRRIEHEVSWLPGVQPKHADKLIQYALNGRFTRRLKEGEVESIIPALASCNLLTECVICIHARQNILIDTHQISELVRTCAEIYEEINTEEILEFVNKDRKVSCFPEITDISFLEECIENQRKELRTSITNLLCDLDSCIERELLTDLVEKVTYKGASQNLSLLDELISDYEMRNTDVHSQLEEEISQLIIGIEGELKIKSNGIGASDIITDDKLNALKEKISKWRQGIYPILLSYKSKGISHKSAESVIAKVRTFYFDAFEKHGNSKACETLCEELEFVIYCVPKLAERISNDLIFLRDNLQKILISRQLRELCEEYETLPETQNALKKNVRACIRLIKSRYTDEEIKGDIADWLCLLLIRYGAALANKYADFNAAIDILEEAITFSPSSNVTHLLEANLSRIKSNIRYIKNRIEEDKEAQKLHALEALRIQTSNRRTNLFSLFASLFILIATAISIQHVLSPEYEWEYLMKQDLYAAARHMPYVRSDVNKKKLTTRIAEEVKGKATPEDRIKTANSIYSRALDDDALFESFTTPPSMENAKLYEVLCPSESTNHKDDIEKIRRTLAEEAWNKLPLPYSQKDINSYKEEYGEYIGETEIEKRVYNYLKTNADNKLIISFYGYFNSSSYNTGLKEVIEKREMEEWNKTKEKISSISALEAYSLNVTSESVKNLIAQKSDNLEWKQWIANKDSCDSREKLLPYVKSVGNERVKREAQEMLERLEWLNNRESYDTESKLITFKNSLQSDSVKKLVDERLNELYADFSFVQKINTKAAYEKFLLRTRNLKEQEKARQKIIDLEVADIARGTHSTLPQPSGSLQRKTRTGYADIEITNETDYSLTVLYSGPHSEKIIIPARSTRNIRLKAGDYQIAVKTEQFNVRPFYGTSKLLSGKYITSYYIESTTRRTYTPSIPPFENYSSSNDFSPDLFTDY